MKIEEAIKFKEDYTDWRAYKEARKLFKTEHLYIIGYPDEHLYKIGVSDRPEERLVSIDNVLPKKVELILLVSLIKALPLEQALHKKFKSNRHRFEWFVLNDTELGEARAFVDAWQAEKAVLFPHPPQSDENKGDISVDRCRHDQVSSGDGRKNQRSDSLEKFLSETIVLSIRVSEKMLDELNNKFPDVSIRNKILRVLIRKLITGKIVLQNHELYQLE